ncbi:MAG: CAP domain-containing protein [Anaerolineae bacterium]|nr:CAP domain-containing protein [Anaerolineae bacterium]
MRYFRIAYVLCLFIIMLGTLQAQDRTNLLPVFAPITPETGTLCDRDAARRLWDGVNEFRRRNNLLPLAFSPLLCQVAQDHVYDLASRPANNIGNQYIRGDGTFLTDWLRGVNYQPYFDTDYVADMRSWVVTNIAPDPTIDTPGVLEYLYNRLPDELLYQQTLSSDYREVGIAFHQGVTRYYYVFIFGSQPNVFPIIPVNPNHKIEQRYEYAYEWDEPEIGLLIHNERHSPTGRLPATLGTVITVNISSIAAEMITCPPPNEALLDGWIRFPFTNVNPYTYFLEGGQGFNTIYVQMCDGNSTGRPNQVVINYTGGSSYPEFKTNRNIGSSKCNPCVRRFRNTSGT